MNNKVAANQKIDKAKAIHLAIVILCCLSSRESPARDLGGFSETLKFLSLTNNTRELAEPIKETIVGKLMVMQILFQLGRKTN